MNQVCPSDFVSDKDGYKLRFTYEIHCNKKCPNNLIYDGKCDKSCNTVECGSDGGDCLDENKLQVDLTNSRNPTYKARKVLKSLVFIAKYSFGTKDYTSELHLRTST